MVKSKAGFFVLITNVSGILNDMFLLETAEKFLLLYKKSSGKALCCCPSMIQL